MEGDWSLVLHELVYHTRIYPPPKTEEPNPLDCPPRVMFQQKLYCSSCDYRYAVHELVELERTSDGDWIPKRGMNSFHPQNSCGLCYSGLKRDGEKVILWPQLFTPEKRQERADKLRGKCRGRPFILGEDKYWIYWSDGLQMAQDTMITRDTRAYWQHHHSITQIKLQYPKAELI